ncbi:MAG: tripartite tricarboxylate transporter substrate binding protein [Kordiimonadaceae bacterium]|nr:tripartite tricarboxylate transporter substrate binding protein [Kordiimonadaceae bacterium]MBT7605489.1 tripartite tricarboxylate transporter substrate binding protein [Kordiimonadaceae bacterium]
MIKSFKKLTSMSLILIMMSAAFSHVQAADFPSKRLTLICPWAAGGGTDTILRGLARNTEPFLGETITIINKTGGSGAIGHAAGVRARPDGYTVTMVTFDILTLPPQGFVPFTYKDYDLLMRVNMDPAAITVPIDAPYNTIEEFVAYSKANPGKIKVGHAGPGTAWHLAGSIFAEKVGIDLAYVPYNGAAPAVTALVGKHIQAVSVSPAEVRGQVEGGTVKILAVMSDERVSGFPEVPTMKEAGFDVSFGTWRGLAVPNSTPEDAKKILHDAFKKGMESDAFKAFAADTGLGVSYMSAEDWEKDLSTSSVSVAKTMKNLGLAR